MAQFFTARPPVEGALVQIDAASITAIGDASSGGSSETSPGGAVQAISGGAYRSVTGSSVYLPSTGEEVALLALRITDPAKKILINFATISTVSGNKPFVWGIALNPTFSGIAASPSWVNVPGSTATQYAVGGTGNNSRVGVTDRGIMVYHSKVLNLTSENNFLDAIALSGIKTGLNYTIDSSQELLFFARSMNGNQQQTLELSFVEVD